MSWARRTRAWGWVAAQRDTLLRLARYASVSVISVTVVTSTLGVLVGLVNAPAVTSGLISNCLGIVISFELNRRWAWGGRSGRARLDQIVGFAAINLLGLLVASVAVHLVDVVARQHHYGPVAKAVVVDAANLGAWGALWLLQFFILDRVLFKSVEVEGAAIVDAVEEIINLVEHPTAATSLPATAPVDSEHIDFG